MKQKNIPEREVWLIFCNGIAFIVGTAILITIIIEFTS